MYVYIYIETIDEPLTLLAFRFSMMLYRRSSCMLFSFQSRVVAMYFIKCKAFLSFVLNSRRCNMILKWHFLENLYQIVTQTCMIKILFEYLSLNFPEKHQQ